MTLPFRAAFGLLRPGAAPRRDLFLWISSAVAAIAAVFAVVAYDARGDARQAAESAQSNLAMALARDIDRNVELLDLSIQAARDAWADPAIRALEPELRQLVVFDRSATARYIDAIVIADRRGAVVADSRSGGAVPADLAGVDAFEAQRARDAGLFIGRPTRMPGRAGWHLALSRRIAGPDGAFAGVAVGYLSLTYVSETYGKLPLGPGGVLSLFDEDGTLLAREPELRGTVGLSFRGKGAFDRMIGPTAGAFEAVSVLDGQSRLYAFHRVGDLPLVQAVAASTESVYAGWRTKTTALGAVLAALCSAIMALLFVLKGELGQRAAAERALAEQAATDPLTGLANRRRFFSWAPERCAEAARDGCAVSVLMIDADHFKGFNDHHGHAAGDEALVLIARAIEGELRAGIDLAARYGGEEFVVFLFGVGRAGAFAVAEAIRAAVLRLGQPHGRSPAGVVTVSAGLAAAEAGAPPDLRALLEAADAELYRAKREGRNRSSGAGRAPAPRVRRA